MKVYSFSSSDSGHGLKLNPIKPMVPVGVLYLNDFLLFILRYHILLVLGWGCRSFTVKLVTGPLDKEVNW